MRDIKDTLSDDFINAIKRFVANISKLFIASWYNIVSETNHDFLVNIEALIEEMLLKLASLFIERLDKYRMGQIVANLLHIHILSDEDKNKIDSIKNQIQEHEYDICQGLVVRLYGLLCNENFRRLILTEESYASEFVETHQSSSGRSTLNFDDKAGSRTTNETSALYTLIVALLTKSVFMPIVELISEPQWLYAVTIWACDMEERVPKDKTEESENLDQTLTERNKDEILNKEVNKETPRQPLSPTIAINNRSSRSLDLEEGIDIVSPSINFENPVCDSLKRPMDSIEIYSTEEVQTNNSCYVLYCVRYNGLCHRHPSADANVLLEDTNVPVIDKRNSMKTPKEASTSFSTTASNQNSTRRSFRRSFTIKRRFREFVILQLRLEENPKIRPYMKNIPKPTKLKAATQNIFSLPGITNIKLDQSTIKLRQRFLERFLLALNNSPFIANSYEFREFFSYNLNSLQSNISISKSKSLILQVNLNKVFVESVRSAFNVIRATLPGDNYHLSTSRQADPDKWLTELQQSTLKLHVQTRTSHTKMNLEKLIDLKLLVMSEKFSSGNIKRFNSRFASRFSIAAGKDLNHRRQSSLMSLRQILETPSQHQQQQPPPPSPSQKQVQTDIKDACARSKSTESVYFDAPADVSQDTDEQQPKDAEKEDKVVNDDNKTVVVQETPAVVQSSQLLANKALPVAQKIIDIVHYSITRNAQCSNSTTNVIARMLLGAMIERYAIHLIEVGFTIDNAAFCVDGITKSLWDEDVVVEPTLDVQSATLNEAVKKLTKLVEKKYVNQPYIPKKLIHSLFVKQIRFYLSQLGSKERNKFVIYDFLNEAMTELEQHRSDSI